MAEDIRSADTDSRAVEADRQAIIEECRRQEESCLYTSTILYIWLRQVRIQKQIFIIAPIILGGAAGFSAFKAWVPDWGIALLAFSASLFPALGDALKFETGIDEIARLAAEYKSLQDRFRQTANITNQADIQILKDTLENLIERLDSVRKTSITPPEWAFEVARKKIEKGDYKFSVDNKKTL